MDKSKTMEDLLLNYGGFTPTNYVATKEPSYHEINDYSGQFKLRIPKELHRQLAEQSQAEGISMNQYCVYLLSQNNAIERVLEQV